MDRFTPVLNDCPFSDYMLTGGCAWGRCEIVALCHVLKPCAVPVRLELLLQSGDKKAALPPLPLLTLLGTVTKSSHVLTVL